MHMKNMGSLDRKIRTILGVLLIAAAIYFQLTVGNFWWIGILGVIFLLTSAVSFCPLYYPFKIRTNKSEE